MKVRCFYPNKNGQIIFTKEDLEKLLNEVYEEGRSSGWAQGYSAGHPVTITYPYTPVWYSTDLTPYITCDGTGDNVTSTTTTTNTITSGYIVVGDDKK